MTEKKKTIRFSLIPKGTDAVKLWNEVIDKKKTIKKINQERKGVLMEHYTKKELEEKIKFWHKKKRGMNYFIKGIYQERMRYYRELLKFVERNKGKGITILIVS